MKKSFIALLRKALFVPSAAVMLISVAGWSVQEYLSWKHEFVEEVGIISEERRNFIRERTQIASSYINFQMASSLSRKKALMESKIADTYEFIDSLYGESGRKDLRETGNLVFRTLDEMSFDDSGGFIMNENGDVLFCLEKMGPASHSTAKTIPAEYLLKNLDANIEGRSLISYVLEDDPKSPGRYKRIFCLKRFRPMSWVIGTSASYTEIEHEAMSTIRGWFSRLESIGPQGFIFISDKDGTIISNSAMHDSVGKNYRDYISETEAKAFVRESGKKNGDFVRILWNPGNGGNSRTSEVLGFTIPEWNWIIGVGFFTDDLEKALEHKKEQGRQEIILGLRFLSIMLPLFFIIGFFGYRRIAVKLERNFLNFHSFFKSAQEKGTRIDSTEMDFSEFCSMAEAANKMLDERQASEARLKQSEANFASFFNSMEDCILVVDFDLRILSMNSYASSLLRFEGTSVEMPENLDAYYDASTLDNLKKFIAYPVEQSKDIGQGYIKVLAFSEGAVSGNNEKIVETFVFQGTWNSGTAFFVLSRDISALVASEEKFSKIFNETPVMMSVSTIEEGRFIDINKEAVEQLEYRREDFIDRLSSEVGIFADPGWRNNIRPILAKYGRIRNEEVDLVTKTGKILHCIFSMDLISYSGKKYILTVANNITERKKAEQSLMAAKEEALASKAKLEETMHELELFNRFMMDREERIISLKEEVNSLLVEAGKNPVYKVTEGEDG